VRQLFKEDVIIKRLPKCGVEGCSNDGFISCAGVFMCGACAEKANSMNNKIMLEALRK